MTKIGICPKCNEEMRIMGQCTLSAPASLMHKFSKSNIRRKDVYLVGVNWETFDFVCECGFVIDAYGNYISNMKKKIESIKRIVQEEFDGDALDLLQTIDDIKGIVK